MNHTPNHSLTTFITDYYITLLNLMTTCTNAQMTTTQIVTNADPQKTTYISLQNAQEYGKPGHTSNQH